MERFFQNETGKETVILVAVDLGDGTNVQVSLDELEELSQDRKSVV